MSIDVLPAEYYNTRPAPSREMPESAEHPRIALQILRSEMLLDGDPSKNLATFVTTHMEDEAGILIAENLHRNFIDHAEYPRTAEIAKRCVRMLHKLFHGPGTPEAPGTATAGSSEAVMLGALAMKWRWRIAREQVGGPVDRPNLVYGADVHVVWDKFCRYFDVEPRKIDVPQGQTVVGPGELEPHIDENTIGVVAVAGTTFTGECDDIMGIDAMLGSLREGGLDVPMHVDAASGGFVFPFSDPDFRWDFRLPSVCSINVSGHKFGQVYPGIGWLIVREESLIPEQLVFYEDYLGERDSTYTLNFSGSSAFILAQYWSLIRFGKEGFASLTRLMDVNARAIERSFEQAEIFERVGGEGPRLPLVCARVREEEPFSAKDLVAQLQRYRGWLVPAYKLPPANDAQEVLRVLVKTNQTRELADALADDIHAAVADLRRRGGSTSAPEPHTGHGY